MQEENKEVVIPKWPKRLAVSIGVIALLILVFSLFVAFADAIHQAHAANHKASNYENSYGYIFRLALSNWGLFFQTYVGAFTLFATAVIACFNWFLVDSTNRLWSAGERQISAAETAGNRQLEIARRSVDAAEINAQVLIAQARPMVVLDIKLVENIIIGDDAFVIAIAPRAKNIGASPAVELRYGFFHVPVEQGRWTLRELIENVQAVELRRGEGQILIPGESMSEEAYMSRRFSIDGEKMRGARAIDLVFWVAYRFMFGDGTFHFTAKYITPFQRGESPGWIGIETPRTIEKERIALVPSREIQD